MKLDAILLDFDGLILDTEPVEFAALSAMFSSRGAELAFAEWHATVGSEGLDWFSRLASPGTPSYDELRREFSRRQQDLLESEPLRPGVGELLGNAREASVPVAVVTSGTRDRVHPELAKRDLLDHIAFLITADDVVETKPSPEPYLRALDRLDADPTRSIAFEDSSRGVAAAVAAGMRCVAVYNDTTREHDFELASLVCDRLDRIDLSALLGEGVVSISSHGGI